MNRGDFKYWEPHPTDPTLVYGGWYQGKPYWVTHEQRDRRLKKMAEYSHKNRAALAEKARNRYHRDPESKRSRLAAIKAWQARTKGERRLRHKARMANDPAYAARERASNAAASARRLARSPEHRAIHKIHLRTSNMMQAIAAGKLPRAAKKLVGVDAATLKQHIERQFTEGMSWENRGQWEVDHIIPLSASLRYPGTLWVLALHWNLRPVWPADNIAKGGAMPKRGMVAGELLALLPEGMVGELG